MGKKKRRVDFSAYYGELFPDRWEALAAALGEESRPVALTEGLKKPYYLDSASLVPVEALELDGADEILDLCAAPGGKSLAIALSMDKDARLTANDRSASRRDRLKRVLDEHLPAPIRERIEVTGHDATRWGLYEEDRYARVLADVPCSSERHLVQDPKYLKQWSPSRSKRLAVQAYAILTAALTALKPGGILVYSTCALSPLENDEVVAKLLKRRGAEFRILAGDDGEATAYGRHILPDRSAGRGPIYYAKLQKIHPETGTGKDTHF